MKEEQVEVIEDMSEKYKDKSEEDIFVEIIQLNAQMEEELTFEEYERIFEKLDSIRHLLSEEQNTKLDRLLDALDKKIDVKGGIFPPNLVGLLYH